MRAQSMKIGAIGAAIGLALAAAVAVPASAAKPQPEPVVSASFSCTSFQGLSATGTPVTYTGVALSAGQSITANVSPAREGDTIYMPPSGFNLGFVGGPAVEGYTFVAPSNGVYDLTFGVWGEAEMTVEPTWSFTASCGTSTSTDADPAPSEPKGKPGKGRGKK